MELERREKSGCGNRRFWNFRWFFHIHRRDIDIVRVRVKSPEENASGKCTIYISIYYIYKLKMEIFVMRVL